MIPSTKKCPKCGEIKQSDSFYRSTKNGLSPYCKPCSAEYKRSGELSRIQMTESVYPEAGKKICSKCKLLKPLSEYNKRARKDNIRPYCKECEHQMFKAWKERKIERPILARNEALKAMQSKIYPTATTKVCSKCHVEKDLSEFGVSSHRFQCKECRSITEKRSYSPEKRAIGRAKWRKNHLEKAREYAINGFHKRRAIKLTIESTLTAKEWKEIVEKYGGKCLCCGEIGPVTMDHIVPISKRGAHSASNVQPLCGSCNSSKGTRVIDYRPPEVACQ